MVGVWQELVCPEDYTGEQRSCRTFEGEQQRYPVAWIRIRSPYITDRVKATVLLNPCSELIIGNSPGVIDVNEDMLSKWKLENNCDGIVTNAYSIQQTSKMLKDIKVGEKVVHSALSFNQHSLIQIHPDTCNHLQTQSQVHSDNGAQGIGENEITLTLHMNEKHLGRL